MKPSKTEIKETEYIKLCHRCEHRVNHLETLTSTPRYECSDIKNSVYSCYMYKPVIPVRLIPNSEDNRPVFGPAMICARMHSTELSKGKIKVIPQNNGYVMYWHPEKLKVKNNV